MSRYLQFSVFIFTLAFLFITTSFTSLSHAQFGDEGSTNTVFAILDEAPGANCENGGIVIASGLDRNRNGKLNFNEVQHVGYVCDGESGEGIPGPEGPQGIAGPPGPAGAIGPAGPAGVAGADGGDGPAGPQGEQGPAGVAGADGGDGAAGPQGEVGPAGPQGEQGPAGADGTNGTVGVQGPPGADGIDGADGLPGINCYDGLGDVNGDTVINQLDCIGPQGVAGTDGADGAQGPAGSQGPIGLTGPAGADGAAGAQGEQGIQGLTGPAGPQGDPGTAGADGAPGTDGSQGNGILILPADNDPDCDGNGTPGTVFGIIQDANNNGIFDSGEIVIDTYSICDGPQGLAGLNGADGMNGATGAQGPQGPAGTDGEDGTAGANASPVSISFVASIIGSCGGNAGATGSTYRAYRDNNSNGVFDTGFPPDQELTTFDICNGTQGPEGPQGPAGANSLVKLDTGTIVVCPDGSTGKKYNVGSDSNGDGSLQSGEVEDSFQVCDGDSGANSLVKIDAGTIVICPDGSTGKKYNVGSDSNGDGSLQSGEVEDSFQICDGADGAEGPQGPAGPAGNWGTAFTFNCPPGTNCSTSAPCQTGQTAISGICGDPTISTATPITVLYSGLLPGTLSEWSCRVRNTSGGTRSYTTRPYCIGP